MSKIIVVGGPPEAPTLAVRVLRSTVDTSQNELTEIRGPDSDFTDHAHFDGAMWCGRFYFLDVHCV